MPLLIFLFNGCSPDIFAKDQDSVLEKFCSRYNGEVKFGFTCPKTKLPLPLKMCHFTNSQGEKNFFDGCTGPAGGFTETFYPACIRHDLCYHHEPVTNGKDQAYCDKLFYDIMVESCKGNAKEQKCLKWAKRLYVVVQSVGKLAFHCENTPGSY